MKRIISIAIPFLVSVITVTVLAVVSSSQRVINQLPIDDASASFGKRLSMSLYDLQHFAPLYGLFILIALLIAFLASALLYRGIKFGRLIIFTVAGGVAIWVMLWAMEQVFFGVPIVAGARDGVGLTLQIFAGGLGGLLFSFLSQSKKNPA